MPKKHFLCSDSEDELWSGLEELSSFNRSNFNATMLSAKEDQLTRKKGDSQIKKSRKRPRVQPSLIDTRINIIKKSNELCVNAKKVSELREWISSAMNDVKETKRILLLSGPPGSGKETTVKSLCAELELSILEWRNTFNSAEDRFLPSECSYFECIKDPSCLEFIDFIHSATLYGNCGKPTVILIKEYPHTFDKNKSEFEHILLNTTNKVYPLIFITNNSRNYPEICAKANSLHFLKIAKTLMKKALMRLKIPLPSNLMEIIEVADGDIRSALNTIEFNSVLQTNKSSCAKSDFQLLLFRALGRILNSKRESDMEVRIPTHLPDHLHRNLLTYSMPEDQCLQSGFLTSSFSEFLHQNMLAYIPNINTLENVSADLSLSDLFSRKYGHEEKIKQYEAVISCRSLSFWNCKPNKVGFTALHRPKNIDVRKGMIENRCRLSTAKFKIFNDTTEAAIVTTYIPSLTKLSPRHLTSLQFADISRFPNFTSHNGKRLEQNDHFTDDSDLEVKLEDTQLTREENYENNLSISDDSDW